MCRNSKVNKIGDCFFEFFKAFYDYEYNQQKRQSQVYIFFKRTFIESCDWLRKETNSENSENGNHELIDMKRKNLDFQKSLG